MLEQIPGQQRLTVGGDKGLRHGGFRENLPRWSSSSPSVKAMVWEANGMASS